MPRQLRLSLPSGPQKRASRAKLPQPRLQARDRKVLVLLAQFGVLSSRELHQLVYAPAREQVTRRRLQALTVLGLVEQLRLPRALAALPSDHAVYVLTRKGTQQLDTPTSYRPLALGTLLHDLGTNRVLLTLAVRHRLRILPEPALRRRLYAARLRVTVPQGFVIPDGAVLSAKQTLLLEFVRSAPRGGLRTLTRKLERYVAWQKSGHLGRMYRVPPVRAVLILSTQPGRTAHIMARATRLARGQRLFLFATLMPEASEPTPWRRADGSPVVLETLIGPAI